MEKPLCNVSGAFWPTTGDPRVQFHGLQFDSCDKKGCVQVHCTWRDALRWSWWLAVHDVRVLATRWKLRITRLQSRVAGWFRDALKRPAAKTKPTWTKQQKNEALHRYVRGEF